MEHRDHAHERFSSPMSILPAETAAARAPQRRARAGARVRVRREIEASFLGPLLFGEGFPFAFLRLTNQRRPGFRLRIERKLVGQLAVFRNKAKFDRSQIVVDLSVPKRRVARAENIHPMANVVLGGGVESDEDKGFILRLWIGVAVVKFNELVVQHPFTTNARLLNLTLAHFSFYAPVANEIIQKRILKRWRRLRLDNNENEEKEEARCRSFH